MNTKNKMPSHLVQTNRQRTMVRLPSVVGFKKDDLVAVPTGETMKVGSLLMRDKGREKRELLMTDRSGGQPVSPITGGGNVFH
tara:strand:- start:55 stop:303 length:249 start_codon:yes stop_codon:yes gene_type:complete